MVLWGRVLPGTHQTHTSFPLPSGEGESWLSEPMCLLSLYRWMVFTAYMVFFSSPDRTGLVTGTFFASAKLPTYVSLACHQPGYRAAGLLQSFIIPSARHLV
eukprot:1160836-Pelagomonas_calceolata.AAC.4